MQVPTCTTFSRFKILIHETLDACTSLDEIDCAAWKEFSDNCPAEITNVFGSIDFYRRKQCDFVKEGCGESGPLPAFRNLDCEGEIPKKNWDFWTDYSAGCALAEASDDDIIVEPVPEPLPSPYVPGGGKPGEGPDGEKKENKRGSAAGPVLGVLGAFCVVAGGAVLYKRSRNGGGVAGAYRFMSQKDDVGDDETEMFGGMTVSSGSFQPPSVPQTHDI